MKKTPLTLLAGLVFATAAQAGSDYSAKAMPQAVAPPCLWSWFAGGSAGYLSGDWDEDIYTLHFGTEYKCPGSNSSHAVFLEVGYTEKDYTEEYYPYSNGIDNGQTQALTDKASLIKNFEINFDIEIIPVTLNYKYEQMLTGNLNWYVGAGAGVAFYDAKLSANFSSSTFSTDETLFYAHVFAGLTYNVSEAFEVFAGVKYVYMDDPDFGGAFPMQDELSPDGDLHIEIGGRFNF